MQVGGVCCAFGAFCYPLSVKVEDMSQDEDEVVNGDQRIVVLKDDQVVIDDDGSEPMSQDGVEQQPEYSPVVTKAEL